MSPIEKQPAGIPLRMDLTRKEHDLLVLGARKDKRDPVGQVRWLIEAYGMGLLKYSEEGAASRNLLRANQSEIHYPDSVTVNMSQADDKD